MRLPLRGDTNDPRPEQAFRGGHPGLCRAAETRSRSDQPSEKQSSLKLYCANLLAAGIDTEGNPVNLYTGGSFVDAQAAVDWPGRILNHDRTPYLSSDGRTRKFGACLDPQIPRGFLRGCTHTPPQWHRAARNLR